MKRRTSSALVPLAFGAIGLVCLTFSGCRREAKGPLAPPPDSPASYMRDPEFRARLDAQVAARNELAATRNMLYKRMTVLVDAKKAAMKGADDKAVKAALEKDPEWNELYRKMTDVNTAIGDNGRKTQQIVRDRVAPKTAKGKKGAEKSAPPEKK